MRGRIRENVAGCGSRKKQKGIAGRSSGAVKDYKIE
jgi:hypothetical protein